MYIYLCIIYNYKYGCLCIFFQDWSLDIGSPFRGLIPGEDWSILSCQWLFTISLHLGWDLVWFLPFTLACQLGSLFLPHLGEHIFWDIVDAAFLSWSSDSYNLSAPFSMTFLKTWVPMLGVGVVDVSIRGGTPQSVVVCILASCGYLEGSPFLNKEGPLSGERHTWSWK